MSKSNFFYETEKLVAQLGQTLVSLARKLPLGKGGITCN